MCFHKKGFISNISITFHNIILRYYKNDVFKNVIFNGIFEFEDFSQFKSNYILKEKVFYGDWSDYESYD